MYCKAEPKKPYKKAAYSPLESGGGSKYEPAQPTSNIQKPPSWLKDEGEGFLGSQLKRKRRRLCIDRSYSSSEWEEV